MKQLNFLNSLLGQAGNAQTLSQALTLYKSLGLTTSSKSPKTRIEYLHDLEDFVRYLEKASVTQPTQVTLTHLRIYQVELEQQGYKASTRNRKTYAMKSFFSFLREYALVKEDIARQLIPPFVERGEPRFLSEAEYTQLLQVCSEHPRDTAIIQIFLQTGIRLSELVGLSVNDVVLASGTNLDASNSSTIRIRRGGGHVIIPLNYKAQNALRKWLEVREPIVDTALFLTGVKKPMGKRAVQLMLEKYLAEAGINNASVQSLRHTMAIHHLAKGTPVKTLADILGDQLHTLDRLVPAAKRIHQKALQEHSL